MHVITYFCSVNIKHPDQVKLIRGSLLFRAVAPNLFCNMGQFHGKIFFTDWYRCNLKQSVLILLACGLSLWCTVSHFWDEHILKIKKNNFQIINKIFLFFFSVQPSTKWLTEQYRSADLCLRTSGLENIEYTVKWSNVPAGPWCKTGESTRKDKSKHSSTIIYRTREHRSSNISGVSQCNVMIYCMTHCSIVFKCAKNAKTALDSYKLLCKIASIAASGLKM